MIQNISCWTRTTTAMAPWAVCALLCRSVMFLNGFLSEPILMLFALSHFMPESFQFMTRINDYDAFGYN